ncbi:MAG: hypothetical protein LBS62_03445 [Clostridiales bacterium]|jgi:hypothetical protein|nr:hypothetical protein [Clostridiales bacterium]
MKFLLNNHFAETVFIFLLMAVSVVFIFKERDVLTVSTANTPSNGVPLSALVESGPAESTISGVVFSDTYANGIMPEIPASSENSVGIPSVLIELYKQSQLNGQYALASETFTGPDGRYVITVPEPGMYAVRVAPLSDEYYEGFSDVILKNNPDGPHSNSVNAEGFSQPFSVVGLDEKIYVDAGLVPKVRQPVLTAGYRAKTLTYGEGASFIVAGCGNDSALEADNFTFEIAVQPGIRADSITIPAFSASPSLGSQDMPLDVTYEVSVKFNSAPYFKIADQLPAAEPHTISFEASDQVTDILLNFGTVPGFFTTIDDEPITVVMSVREGAEGLAGTSPAGTVASLYCVLNEKAFTVTDVDEMPYSMLLAAITPEAETSGLVPAQDTESQPAPDPEPASDVLIAAVPTPEPAPPVKPNPTTRASLAIYICMYTGAALCVLLALILTLRQKLILARMRGAWQPPAHSGLERRLTGYSGLKDVNNG